METVLKFKGKWRDYQQRILDNLNYHLADNKIHVVAAPGAGKTTLGIEVIARINKPTMILAPTITIRDQWKQRIIDAFLNGNSESIISTNIREPEFITVITYQSLLAAFCGREDDEKEELSSEENDVEEDEKETTFNRLNKDKANEVIAILKKAKIDILCFDEAHHLRNEWWKALMYLIEHLNPKQMVSLTATPPYDADTTEWQRYSELCGSIDEVISIPELVQNGDLCPHQDFIHFSLLRQTESEELKKSVERTSAFINFLLSDEKLQNVISKYLAEEDIEIILDTPKAYMALAAYLKAALVAIPSSFLKIFDFKEKDIPKFNDEYKKIFLNFILFKDNKKLNDKNKELIEDIYNRAKAAGVIYNKSVYLNDSPKVRRQIANSLGKLDSIKDIVELETKALKDKLRMVILTDYIKYDITDCSVLGVIPIWQTLKERKDISLCVLTGSIILIPAAVKEAFNERIKQKNLDGYVSSVPFDRDENFLKVTSKGAKKSCIVELITDLFNDGHLTVMVGTQALLGEGWDAPSINSLILSSTVSSYMLSNQMRGRAIRKDRNNPDKVSNIWHLASVKVLTFMESFKQQMPSKTQTETEPNVQLFDYLQLCQRFKGYEAPAFKEPYYIENGIERILPDEFNKMIKYDTSGIKESDFININAGMKMQASNREHTKELWQKGLVKQYNTPEQSLRTGVSTTERMTEFYYSGGFYSILLSWFSIFGVLAVFFFKAGLYMFGLIAIICFIVVMFQPTIKYLKCSSPEKIMRQIGIVILETLSYMGEIKTNMQRINIQCKQNPLDMSIFFSVTNVSPEENNIIIKSIMEFLDPIENPRYIFIRKGIKGKLQTTDYHAIPAIIGQKKENTDIFKGLWNKYIGECDVVYTRSIEGRKLLIKARKEAFSELVQDSKSKKLSRYE